MLRLQTSFISSLPAFHCSRSLGTGSRDFYEVLGVGRNATKAEIKSAYYELAKTKHPDANPDDSAAEAFNEITVAYHTLVDDAKRRAYDSSGGRATDAQQQDPWGTSQGDAGGAFSVFEALLKEGGFADVLGFGAVGRAVGSAFGWKPSPLQGPQSSAGAGSRAATTVPLEVGFMEAVNGARKEIGVTVTAQCKPCSGTGDDPASKPAKCKSCAGTGTTAEGGLSACKKCSGSGLERPKRCTSCGGAGGKRVSRTVPIEVPIGAVDGEVLQAQVPGGDTVDTVFVHLKVKPHAVFRREGTDVHVDVPLSMAHAALGGAVRVPLVDGGQMEIRLHPGTQPGDKQVFFNRGIRRLGTIKRGNLVVHFKVVVPGTLSEKGTDLLRQYREEEALFAPKSRWWIDAFRQYEDLLDSKQKEKK